MFTSRRSAHGYSLTDILTAVVILGLTAAIVLPVIRPARRSARATQNSTATRGIHTALVLYAQDNNTYYPGLDRDGQNLDLTIENRFRLLLEENYFTGEYAISPSETKHPWTTGEVSASNYSYSMLHIPDDGQRRVEWRETTNTEAPVLSDRAIANGKGAIRSVHTNPAAGVTEWRGSIAWNDNHVTFEADASVDTRYGNQKGPTTDDHLFSPTTADDASMVYTNTANTGL